MRGYFTAQRDHRRAVPKPKLSAPSSAALITSRPVFRPPSVRSSTRPRSLVGLQGLPRLDNPVPRHAGVADPEPIGLAPVPSWPAMVIRSAPALAAGGDGADAGMG